MIGLLHMIGLIGVHLCIKSKSQFTHLRLLWRAVSYTSVKGWELIGNNIGVSKRGVGNGYFIQK